jgi:protein subunit release factor B
MEALLESRVAGGKQMRITNDLVVDDHEIKERFVRSMGADGQNPRRKATAVELRFDIESTFPSRKTNSASNTS